MQQTYKLNGKEWTGTDLVFKHVTLTAEDGETVVVTVDLDTFDWRCPEGNAVQRVENHKPLKGTYPQPLTRDGRPLWNNGNWRRKKRR